MVTKPEYLLGRWGWSSGSGCARVNKVADATYKRALGGAGRVVLPRRDGGYEDEEEEMGSYKYPGCGETLRDSAITVRLTLKGQG